MKRADIPAAELADLVQRARDAGVVLRLRTAPDGECTFVLAGQERRDLAAAVAFVRRAEADLDA